MSSYCYWFFPIIHTMLSLNYQFNENHSLGARYDYDRTPERHETVYPMNTLVYQDNALYEESHTTGWRNTQETRHTKRPCGNSGWKI